MDPRLNADLESGALAERLAEIAEEAGALILRWWRADPEVFVKADDSPVTVADREAETLILARLLERWPAVQAVAEEQVARDGEPAILAETFWLIDPLDGTRGFVRGGENFTVNIALIHQRYPVAGVVTAPALGRTWRSGGTAERAGAFARDGSGVWRSVAVRARGRVATAVVSHSLTSDEAGVLSAGHGCEEWTATDSSLKFCLVAEGRCDLYPRDGSISEWDTAAGQAVLEAAGGRVLTLDGERLSYGKPSLINPGFVAMGG